MSLEQLGIPTPNVSLDRTTSTKLTEVIELMPTGIFWRLHREHSEHIGSHKFKDGLTSMQFNEVEYGDFVEIQTDFVPILKYVADKIDKDLSEIDKNLAELFHQDELNPVRNYLRGKAEEVTNILRSIMAKEQEIPIISKSKETDASSILFVQKKFLASPKEANEKRLEGKFTLYGKVDDKMSSDKEKIYTLADIEVSNELLDSTELLKMELYAELPSNNGQETTNIKMLVDNFYDDILRQLKEDEDIITELELRSALPNRQQIQISPPDLPNTDISGPALKVTPLAIYI